MRKTLFLLLCLIVAAGLVAGCRGTYQCEGAASDIRNAGNYDRAIENMLAYVEGEGADQPCARVMLFWAYAEKGNFGEAVKWREEALAMDPTTQEKMDALIVERNFFVIAQNATIEAFNRSDYMSALENAKYAQELDEDYYLSYYLAAEAYVALEIEAAENDNPELAEEYAQLAADEYYLGAEKLFAQYNDPDTIYKPVLKSRGTQVYVRAADVLINAEDFERANEALDMGLEHYPGAIVLKIARADIMFLTKQYEGLEAYYNQLIEEARTAWENAEPDFKEAARDLYVIVLDKAGLYYITRDNLNVDDLQVAVELYRTGFEINPDDIELVKHFKLVLDELKFSAEDAPWIAEVFDKYDELMNK